MYVYRSGVLYTYLLVSVQVESVVYGSHPEFFHTFVLLKQLLACMMRLLCLGCILIVLCVSCVCGVRICLTRNAEATCQAAKESAKGNSLDIICIPGADRYDCLKRLIENEADVLWADAEDVFLARELYGPELQVVAESRSPDSAEDSYRYQGVAVVRKSKISGVADLRGSKSCHTGYARTAGWNIPFSHLLNRGEIKLQCDQTATVVEHDIRAASAYFGLACVPGRWAPDEETNDKLKQQYNNLCSMCGNPGRCDDQDIHAGYEGSLRCLVNSHGDVAWTKFSAATKFFAEDTTASSSDFGLLCPDGVVMDLNTSDPCHWAARPWTSWITKATNENPGNIVAVLRKVVEAATLPPEQGGGLSDWAIPILGTRYPIVIHQLPTPVLPQKFLAEPGYDVTIERLGCPEVPVKLCVDHRIARDKCRALQQVLKSRRVRPSLECVTPTSPDDCLAMVANGDAHIMSADGGDMFRGHVEYGTVPVVSERYGHLDASYFAVAVVRADSGITSFHQLKGKKSCHTAIDKTAGWKIPVVTLQEGGLLNSKDCDYAHAMGKFFSSSCAPGAKDLKYDPIDTNPESLCDLCIGNDVSGASGPPYGGVESEGKCERSPVEAFYGYTGAFRCLVQGGGDVAFVKHVTVAENTNGNNNASWAAGLRAVDFKLLCKFTGTADIVDYNTCNLARVPAHKVITGMKSDKIMMEEIRIMLLRASDTLPKGQDTFTMFGPFRGRQDIIFKDSATALVNVREDIFHKSLDDAYYRALIELNSCKPQGPSSKATMPEQNDPSSAHRGPCHLILGFMTSMLVMVFIY